LAIRRGSDIDAVVEDRFDGRLLAVEGAVVKDANLHFAGCHLLDQFGKMIPLLSAGNILVCSARHGERKRGTLIGLRAYGSSKET
jgi:hypothetical protein